MIIAERIYEAFDKNVEMLFLDDSFNWFNLYQIVQWMLFSTAILLDIFILMKVPQGSILETTML